jgi:hypothetical protein
MKNIYGQHPLMSKRDLRTELELLLTEDIQAGPSGEPDATQVRKASRAVDRVLTLVEKLLQERGVTVV